MRYAVIGAAGQVGQEFAKCLTADGLVPITHEQLDVADAASVERLVGSLECDVLVNLAAFHDVNGCEKHPGRGFEVNAMGACYVATAAARRGIKVVYVSSDYVFGLEHDRERPYIEQDVVGPINVYGATKAAGEQLVRAATDNHLIVRTSSLFGVVISGKGWTFPEMILERAKASEPLRVVTDQYMSPTYTLDLVRAIVGLLDSGATGTLHVTNGGGCTWHDFATATLELAGVNYPIERVTSDAFPSIARRPAYSRLDSQRFDTLGASPLREWREGLRAYLCEKGVMG